MKMIGARFAAAVVAILITSGTAFAQRTVDLGNCTPGDLKCAVDTVLVCDCYDEWREIDGVEQRLTVCVWEETGDDCGKPVVPVQPPPCNESYVGATFEFTDEVKECSCNDETGCMWKKAF